MKGRWGERERKDRKGSEVRKLGKVLIATALGSLFLVHGVLRVYGNGLL